MGDLLTSTLPLHFSACQLLIWHTGVTNWVAFLLLISWVIWEKCLKIDKEISNMFSHLSWEGIVDKGLLTFVNEYSFSWTEVCFIDPCLATNYPKYWYFLVTQAYNMDLMYSLANLNLYHFILIFFKTQKLFFSFNFKRILK